MKYVDKIIFRNNETYIAFYSGSEELFRVNASPAFNGLTFTAIEPSTVSLSNSGTNAPDLKYSLDGTHWTQWDYSPININAGQKVYFKGSNGTQFGKSADDYSTFVINGMVDASGKITSLLDDGTDTATELGNYCFRNLFNGCTGLVSAPELPDIVLGEYCYHNLFYGCSNLVNVQGNLTSTTGLKKACYFGMFHNCTSLTKAPILGNTKMEEQCYTNLFYGCTSLVNAPALPATTLATYCYQNMFKNCTGLVNAPATLPATTLANRCYIQMFYGCTSLTKAPKLPATRLVTGCYTDMFNGCSSLNYIDASFTTTPSTTYTGNWVNGVAEYGNFIKNTSATWNVRGVNGIPTKWIIGSANYFYIEAINNIDIDFYSAYTTKPNLYYTETPWNENSWTLFNFTAYSDTNYKWYDSYNLTSGTRMYIRGTNAANGTDSIVEIKMMDMTTGRANVGGDITTLYNVNGTNTITKERCFADIFDAWGYSGSNPFIVDASNLKLPNTLSVNGLRRMFYHQDYMTAAPKLTSMNLAHRCYYQMFTFCNLIHRFDIYATSYTKTPDNNPFESWAGLSPTSTGTLYVPSNRTYDANELLPNENWVVQEF